MTTKITGDNIDNIANVGVKWNAVTVADGSTQLSASAGNGYFLDTNTGVIEVILPSSPSRGDTIILMDYAGTFATNQVLVNTVSNNLDSTNTRIYKLTTNDTIAEFVYVDSAKGWVTKINTTTGTTPTGALINGQIGVSPSYITATGGTITTTGTNFKVHSFTGDGTFCVSVAGNAPLFPCNPLAGPNVVDYLVVAGGGGGGRSAGGGGGAGGYRESGGTASGCYTVSTLGSSPTSVAGITIPSGGGSFPVTVGGGGSAPTGSPDDGGQGNNSIFSTITSAGGGAGGGRGCEGHNGGSGGGYGADSGHYDFAGTGNTPPVSPPQGSNGGGPVSPGVNNVPTGACHGTGGGGATQAGQPWPTTRGQGTNAGNGAASEITGSSVTRAGGGGGAGCSNGPNQGGTGGSGGGGAGGNSSQNGAAGSANTGGGGGGSRACGAAGGKGIVILRYKFQ